MTSRYRPWLALVLAAATATLGGCSGSSASDGDGAPQPRTDHHTVTIGELAAGVSVVAGVPTTIVYTSAIPPSPVLGMTVDLLATLPNVHVSTPGSLLDALTALVAGPSATLAVRIAPASPTALETVCASGLLVGTYTVGLDPSSAPNAADPASAAANATALTIINGGTYVTCLEVTSPVDATFSVDGTVVAVTHDCPPGTASFAGSWVGTYECSSSCGGAFGGSITMDVTETSDGNAVYADQGGATFRGPVCAREFRFARNTAFETERGILTLNANGTATKRSSYRGTFPPFCSGDCVDQLHRP
jgi:hypothetical protein